MSVRLLTVVVLVVILAVSQQAVLAQTVVVREAPEIQWPSGTDSNNPAHWDGDTFYVFNSGGKPTRSSGTDQFNLTDKAKPFEWDNEINGKRWIECTWKAPDGTLYGWYHNEPGGLCPGARLTAPRIGAASSLDNGAHWHDLGLVLEARPNTLECGAKNGFFAGGNGDFSCMLDKEGKYIYFFISTYSGGVTEQGVSVARMPWKYRDDPVGRVQKWYNGSWSQPGVGGLVSPIFPGITDWKRRNAESFWGPSIHWNTYLKKYVILLNHTCCSPGWPQAGIFISYSENLSDPRSWTAPKKFLDGGNWYPQILGIDKKAKETDKLAGHQARFYMHTKSRHEIIFFRDGEDTTKLPPVYEPAKAE